MVLFDFHKRGNFSRYYTQFTNSNFDGINHKIFEIRPCNLFSTWENPVRFYCKVCENGFNHSNSPSIEFNLLAYLPGKPLDKAIFVNSSSDFLEKNFADATCSSSTLRDRTLYCHYCESVLGKVSGSYNGDFIIAKYRVHSLRVELHKGISA